MSIVHIISGFLGAGKTTFIQMLLKHAFQNQKVVLIENEFGEIGIDGAFLTDSGMEVKEINSGCICCSLTGDFKEALADVSKQYQPDIILIEPSGVGKLSDVIKAVETLDSLTLGSSITVVDAKKCKLYHKNFGEFFNNQIQYGDVIAFSRTQMVSEEILKQDLEIIEELNPDAMVITTKWSELDEVIFKKLFQKETLRHTLLEEMEICEVCGCHHEHDHHHDHHEEHHHEHHHHHADEVFESMGASVTHHYSKEELEKIVSALASDQQLGMVLRAKGVIQGQNEWYHFDVTGNEYEIRIGKPNHTSEYCVIGKNLNQEAIKTLFGE